MISGEHDFAYHPVLADATAFLQASNSSRFLLVGDSLNDGDGMTGSHAATNGTTGRSAAASRTRLGFAESVQRSCLRERRRRSDGSPRSSATASSP